MIWRTLNLLNISRSCVLFICLENMIKKIIVFYFVISSSLLTMHSKNVMFFSVRILKQNKEYLKNTKKLSKTDTDK